LFSFWSIHTRLPLEKSAHLVSRHFDMVVERERYRQAVEEQAMDRAHRIGQTRDVHVSRLYIKDTIEERILALQDKKRKLAATAFDEDARSSGMRSVSRILLAPRATVDNAGIDPHKIPHSF
jgi:hypothetical protein